MSVSSSPRRLSAVPREGAARAGQMSPSNRMVCADQRRRGRAVIRVCQPGAVRPDVSRAAARAGWARFVARTCGSRDACAVVFGVTFQCACNWFDGFSAPQGDKMLLGAACFPAAFADLVAEVAA